MGKLTSSPFSQASEDGCIGSVLLEPSVIDNMDLIPSDFYCLKNAIMWETFLEMRATNKPLDAITIGQHLKDNGGLDRIGGYDRMIELQSETLVPSHSTHYSSDVKRYSMARKEIKIMQGGLDLAFNGESASAHVLGALTSLSVDKPDDIGLDQHGENFLESCRQGEVGHLKWWCPEWTAKLGKLSTEIFILHAPRSTGKTAMMLQWITEIHRECIYAPLVSIEMLKKDLAPRFISNIGQVSTFVMRSRGHVTDDEDAKATAALQEIRGLDLRVREGEASMDDIFKFAIMEANKIAEKGRRLGALWVDNLLCINDGGTQYQSKTIMYDSFIKKFRELRNILQVPIFILAHPNAEGNIAWSKDVENIADIILYLDNVPSEGVSLKGSGTFIAQRDDVVGKHLIARFQKNRDGIQPTASLDFVGGTQTFKHLDWED